MIGAVIIVVLIVVALPLAFLMTGGVLLYEMCTISVAVMLLKSSAARCAAVPTPEPA